MFIRSERLFLRPGWPEDWEELVSRISDRAVVQNLAAGAWPYTARAARAFAAKLQHKRYPQFVVTLPSGEGSQLIGCAGLRRGEQGAELGYWIAPERWGQGYATEAGRAVLSLARTLGHRLITALHFTDNPASGQVLRKLGFSSTGEIRQQMCPARGYHVPSRVHRRDLGAPSDCDGATLSGAIQAA
jgi:RimJ/RimL family protein N-acetyltransferase